MQEMVIYGVSFDMVGKQPIVLLKAVDMKQFLLIWIETGRPRSDQAPGRVYAAADYLRPAVLRHARQAAEVACTRVSVTELRENTDRASITLSVCS